MPGTDRSETPCTYRPKLTENEREAVFDRYDTWLRAPSGRHSSRCHLPAGDGDGDEDPPTPVCGASVGDEREWQAKDPVCFPGEWARRCITCAELAVRDE